MSGRTPVESPNEQSSQWSLRPHQQHALDALVAHFATGARRAQLILPCGTGKTRVGAALAGRLGHQRVLVTLPSLVLVEQTLREWHQLDGLDIDPIVVCSDPSTTEGIAEREDRPGVARPRIVWHRTNVPVTTNPDRLARLLSRGPRHGIQVVLSTYHSLPVLATAITYAATPVTFDVLVADEAHRLAGHPSAAFRLALDDNAIPARARLHMTATPITIDTTDIADAPDGSDADAADGDSPRAAAGSGPATGLLGMDDVTTFGPVVYRMAFGEAIERGLLSDYRVLIVAGDSRVGDPSPAPAGEDGDSDDADHHLEATAVGALRAAAVEHQLGRVLAFHGRVRAGERFVGLLNQAGPLSDGRPVWARLVAADMPISVRRATLDHFATHDGSELAVVSNARCLSEGIDLPSVDTVVFASPKTSMVDIVQSVGRVLRKAPGKELGTVIIPVALPEGGSLDEDSALLASAFGHVWSVLRALRVHDDRLADQLDTIAREGSRRGVADGSRNVAGISWLLPEGVKDAVAVRMIRQVASSWEAMFGLLQRHVDRYGTADLNAVNAVNVTDPSSADVAVDDANPGPLPHRQLAAWVARQRTAHCRGVLPSDRARRLEALTGWRWTRQQASWWKNLEALSAFADANAGGTPSLDLDLASATPAPDTKRTLGQFAARQRVAHRTGELSTEQVVALQGIPGWQWQAVDPADAAMVDRLSDYVAWERDANVPVDYLDGRVPLGAWLNDIRRRKVVGSLTAALYDEVLAVTPTPSSAGALRWNAHEVLWELGRQAASQYATREGNLRVPEGHREVVDDTEVRLYEWMRARRHERRIGRLGAARIEQLTAIPGWWWHGQRAPRTRTDIGDADHGTRTGYVKGCRCEDCSAAQRAYNTALRQRQLAGEDIQQAVSAEPARQHVEQLLAAGASVRGLCRASGVSRSVLQGIRRREQERVLCETAERIVEVTLEEALAADGRPVDAGPTWQLLEQMISDGWPKAWIARELGAQSGTLNINRVQVNVQTARKVQRLAERIAGRKAPARGPRDQMPPLEEILAAEGRSPVVSAAA